MVRAEDWIPVSNPPKHGQVCFISDGKEFAVAQADRHFKPGAIWWDAVAFSGMGWEWDIEPTHWAPARVEQPITDSKTKD
jgi:hypothetical protein